MKYKVNLPDFKSTNFRACSNIIGYRGQARDFDSRSFMKIWDIIRIKIVCQSPVKRIYDLDIYNYLLTLPTISIP